MLGTGDEVFGSLLSVLQRLLLYPRGLSGPLPGLLTACSLMSDDEVQVLWGIWVRIQFGRFGARVGAITNGILNSAHSVIPSFHQLRRSASSLLSGLLSPEQSDREEG